MSENAHETPSTASFRYRPEHNVITRYDVETLGLALITQGHSLEILIGVIAEARCNEEAYDLLAAFEKAEHNKLALLTDEC